jgi:hypothetical protein
MQPKGEHMGADKVLDDKTIGLVMIGVAMADNCQR